jgi:hypothetical protein
MSQSIIRKAVQYLSIIAFFFLLLQGCSHPGLSDKDIQLRISGISMTKPFAPAEVTVNIISQNHSDYTTKNTGWLVDGVNKTVSNNTISNLAVGTHSVQAYVELSTGSILYSNVQTFQVFSANDYLPQVSAPVTVNTTANSATLSASVTDDKGYAVIERGFCWSATAQQPSTADNKTAAGNGSGTFSAIIAGLATGTSYFVRAYATNAAGTGYSSVTQVNTINPTLSVSKSSLSLAGNASNDIFTVTSNASWTVSCNNTWCTAAVSGNQVTVSVNDNLSGAVRIATVKVAVSEQLYQNVTVTQAKPTLTVSKTEVNFGKQAINNDASNGIVVTSNVSLWSVSSNQNWCTVSKRGTNGVYISLNANTTGANREAIISISLPNDTQTLKVIQSGL